MDFRWLFVNPTRSIERAAARWSVSENGNQLDGAMEKVGKPVEMGRRTF